jgi:hypothetical protein
VARDRVGAPPASHDDDHPVAAGSGQVASIMPNLELSAEGSFPSGSGRGRTIYPDDPSFSPEISRAEEEHRVQERVNGMAADTMAEARAQRGLPHPYFASVREAVGSKLEAEARAQQLGAPLSQVIQKIGTRYADAAESFGQSGNPNLGPPGINPTQSEKLKELLGDEPNALTLRTMVQATETLEALKHGKPLLTLTLELRQSKAGGLSRTILLQGSGDSRFDRFVLDVWPRAIGQAGVPPLDAFHADELRSIWEVEGWLRIPKALERALAYVPTPGLSFLTPIPGLKEPLPLGTSLDSIAAALSDQGYEYDFRARLLRAY